MSCLVLCVLPCASCLVSLFLVLWALSDIVSCLVSLFSSLVGLFSGLMSFVLSCEFSGSLVKSCELQKVHLL